MNKILYSLDIYRRLWNLLLNLRMLLENVRENITINSNELVTH